MKIERENLPKSRIKLTITLPPELMRGYFVKAYNKLAPNVEVKGFRKGMAPKNLTIGAIGEARLSSDILDEAISDSFFKALQQEKIVPVAQPEISVKMMKDLMNDNAELQYEANVDTVPEIKVGDYKKIRIKAPKEKIIAKKEEIDQVLSHLQRQHADFKEVDRPAKNGDRVEIDFEGTEKGVRLENLSSVHYPVILGTGVLLPDFEKNVIGMKVNDEKEFDMPMEQKNAQGKTEKKKIHFKVKMNDVKEVILPELNDEFAKKFQMNSFADLKKRVEEDVLKQKESARHQEMEGKVIEELVKITKVDVPESLIHQEEHRMIDDMRQRTSMLGLPFEKYLEQIGKTEHDLHEELHEQAEKTVKIGLALGEVGKAENIELKDEGASQKIVEKLLSYATK